MRCLIAFCSYLGRRQPYAIEGSDRGPRAEDEPCLQSGLYVVRGTKKQEGESERRLNLDSGSPNLCSSRGSKYGYSAYGVAYVLPRVT